MQLQELKQRASGNMDEPFLNPGINEKQPLHVVMVSLISTCNFVQKNIVRILCFGLVYFVLISIYSLFSLPPLTFVLVPNPNPRLIY